ncbi:MAG TPA: asparagine synthase (glutamine-hydrolyzing) [Xanthobacteraceae bacterium]|nr:asparagine synthase (glutamine-hydrolyzing) [Xanthobacteraceae bacterium]
MCGICGLLTFDGALSRDQLNQIARSMQLSLRYRGPDDEGVWLDPEAPVALAHRRLSIIDLSPAGHQPMVSSDQRFVITYNGEIFNHEEIRSELIARGVRFRGQSDTEVMVEAFSAYGVVATIKRLIGMFAFGVWDRRERTLTLVRDRLGIKPIYWAKFGNLFLFGSELKALRVCPGWTPYINRDAVVSFMRFNYVPAPRTIYQDVYKLEPGTILTLPWGGEPRIERFWDARAIARAGLANPLRADARELIDQLEALLRDAVRRRMIADVPLGAFLSGGIDSSTVVALMQAAHSGTVRTYTVGFDIAGFDEARHAAAVAGHLGTEHTEMTVTAKEAMEVIPRLPDMYDEPFADSSQIPTHLVSVMTRRHVTVALSGDGGDEVFAGYNRYRLASRTWQAMNLLPRPLRRTLAASISSVAPERWSRLLSFLPENIRPRQIGDKLHKLATVLDAPDGSFAYRRLVSHWEPADVMIGGTEPRGIVWDASITEEFPDLLRQMQFLDLVTYLPDDILTKVDRASMAVALEVRVPLLDHRVVEFAWRLPAKAKLSGGITKWILRKVLERHVPRKLFERPKTGFTLPLAEWLRGPLRPWAEHLLAENRLREAGLLDPQVVRRYWSEHLSGERNWQYLIWDVLMLEAWRERWLQPTGSSPDMTR